MIRLSEHLGVGLYSASEAALYAGVSPQLMSRWIYGTGKGEPVIKPQLGRTDDKIVTFLDFVQALAIRRIRNERRIPLDTIREAYIRARHEFKIEYPFALDSTRIGLFGPPDEPKKQVIYICLDKDEQEVQKYFQLTGRKHGNQLIGEVVLTYAYRLVYDKDTGLAKKYTAFENKSGRITMDPEIRFGEPFIESAGYTWHTLYDAYKSEGSVKRAADIYGVSQDQIELAIEFFHDLKPAAA